MTAPPSELDLYSDTTPGWIYRLSIWSQYSYCDFSLIFSLHFSPTLCSLSGILQKESLQQRVTYTQSQKNILQEWYEHNPYPDADTLEQLAKILHVPGSRPHRRPFTRDQVGFLRKAFQKNRLPDRDAREIMAMKIGTEESRIQTWFEKQRILNPEHREELVNLSYGTNGGPHFAAQPQYLHLLPLPACCFPSSNPCCKDQIYVPAPLESQGFVGVFGSPGPGTMTLQATEAVQEGQNLDAPLTYMSHSPEWPIIGQGFSDTQAPFCSQPNADHEKQPEDPEYTDISYIMQWWDKGRLDLIAKWEPQKEV
ncbi:double homeobox protein B [Phodopus roborovskii]|uniref:double homeobox protein B n=1 Tax=Phodopus roborovskii TaxID=109678 RepID=UPI0021E36934|nr:double homeobox protein B [Phodopus roborovskii]